MSVTVDDREPAGLVRAVRDHGDVTDVEVVRLPSADLVVGDVGVERKTPRDYVNAVFAASGPDLYEQVERMREQYAHTYVLVEGDLTDLEAAAMGPDPAAVRGSLASIVARLDTPVIPCSDRERLVDLAVRLGRKHVEAPSERRLPTGSVTTRSAPVTQRMYGCIDGIGPTMAARLAEAFPTVAALVEASPQEIQRVEGVGEKRAEAVYASVRGG